MGNDDQKICLVTGANSGLGKEIAMGLAKSRAHVIMICRDFNKGQAALEEIKIASGSQSVDLLITDLSSQKSIQLLSKTIYERYPKLNVLINNAGALFSKKIFSVDGIEMTLATNYLGPLRLTLALQSLLEKSVPSRIINISSDIHKWAKLDLAHLQYKDRKYQFIKAYAQSKLLMNIMTFDLARKLEGTGITVNCVHPGAVKTALGSNNAHSVLLKFIDKLVKFFFLTPKKAAKPILDLIMSPELENTTGKYFVKGRVVKPSPDSYDTTLAKKLWAISKQWLIAN
jgi:NAD(P)-dependent dehydrogenase (short-subunit alcohol dehydrogenase family)